MTLCKFSEIKEGGFFMFAGIKLCKFGPYGMGIGPKGTVAEKFKDNNVVLRIDSGEAIESNPNSKIEK